MSTPSILLADSITPCCDDEDWKPIPDWPHEASTCGQVRSVDRTGPDGILRLGQMLPPELDKRPGKGYLYATLRDGKRRRRAHIAVLVLEAHRGTRPKGNEACHTHGLRTDNHLARIRWDTREANIADMLRHRAEREQGCDRYPPETSQEARFPRWTRSVICHSPSVTETESKAQERSAFLPAFLSHFISLNPFVRSVRSLLSRKAA